MAFFNSAVTVLQTLVIALGAGLGIWGAINLLEGYGNDNPGAKSQGMKQLMAGGGVALIGTTLVPLLSGLFGESQNKEVIAFGQHTPTDHRLAERNARFSHYGKSVGDV